MRIYRAGMHEIPRWLLQTEAWRKCPRSCPFIFRLNAPLRGLPKRLIWRWTDCHLRISCTLSATVLEEIDANNVAFVFAHVKDIDGLSIWRKPIDLNSDFSPISPAFRHKRNCSMLRDLLALDIVPVRTCISWYWSWTTRLIIAREG